MDGKKFDAYSESMVVANDGTLFLGIAETTAAFKYWKLLKILDQDPPYAAYFLEK